MGSFSSSGYEQCLPICFVHSDISLINEPAKFVCLVFLLSCWFSQRLSVYSLSQFAFGFTVSFANSKISPLNPLPHWSALAC